MHYSKIYSKNIGFTNQIMSLIYSIIIAIHSKQQVVVVDKFSDDESNTHLIPISHIINLKELNEFLIANYNIIVLDKCYAKFKLLSVEYGTDMNKIDITEEIKNMFLSNDRLFINKSIDFNLIKGDPSFGRYKNIYLKYEIFDNIISNVIEEIHNEKLTNDIVIDISNSEYKFEFINLNDLTKTNYRHIYENIWKNIKYTDTFNNLAFNITKNIDKKKINVIHLRVEEDAIKHWSKINNMSYNSFKSLINRKYINIIKKYMNKSDKIIILSYSVVNDVVNFLISNNYDFMVTNKHFENRERNAIVDLLVSRVCNNIFVGCLNNEKQNGSTFSNYISKILDKSVMKIGIDIDSCIHDESIFINPFRTEL